MKKLAILLAVFFVLSSFSQQDAQVHYDTGLKSLKSKDYIKAIGDFTNAISMKPSYGEAYVQRAIAKNLLAEEAGFENNESCFDLVQGMRLGNKLAMNMLERSCMNQCFDMKSAFLEPDLVLCADFSNKILQDIPPNTSKLVNIIKVNLYNNKLTSLSAKFEGIPSVMSVDLSSNKIKDVSPSIGKLTNLRELNLSKNLLTELPSEFGGLDDLKFLYLRSNLLTELPKSIARLKSLETLDLSLNKLTGMPIEIASLKKLKTLNLVGNEIPKDKQKIIQALLPGTKIYFE